jgi:trans-aconitate 2-methyltransferase
MVWDPDQYARFSRERSRPFFDLLARVEQKEVRHAVDLGCGPGELTRVLAERWPGAQVIGIDSSAEMLERSRQHAIPGRLFFQRADIAGWRSEVPLDLIISNAAFQWVPSHETLLPGLIGMLAPGGTIAVQIPNNVHMPYHQAIARVAQGPNWGQLLRGVGSHSGSVKALSWYAEWLRDEGFLVDAWETMYYHLLQGENPALEWMKGTALRPLLARLSREEESEFLREVGAELKALYPPTPKGLFFPFPRIFFVATRPA